MKENFPGQKKNSRFLRGALAAIGLTAGVGAVTEAVSTKSNQFPVENGAPGRGQEGETDMGELPKSEQHENQVENEHAKTLVDFEKGLDKKYEAGTGSTEADRSILSELQEHAMREYLRFHPKIDESIKERFGGTPLVAGDERVVYVIASGNENTHLGVYAGRKQETHLFDLGIKEINGQYEYVLRNPAPELGIAEDTTH